MSTTLINFETFADNIKAWANDRQLISLDNHGAQLGKLIEERDEFISAVYDKIPSEINKEWADVLVVWLVVGMIHNVNFSEAWTATWDKIKDRKGKTVNGQFVKEV